MPNAAHAVPLIVESNNPAVADAIGALEANLLTFYESNASYYDCAASADKSLFFEPIAAMAHSIVASRSRIRILEVGAGKSDLPDYLRRTLSVGELDFVAHDINPTNATFYRERQIPLMVGALTELKLDEPFDIVVSFFAYEHMTRPAECLGIMRSMLRADGRLIIVCPKYTSPLYIPPAIRHLSRLRQLIVNFALVCSALVTRLTGRPKFHVVVDPAVFHAAWRRDFDAVHMVSGADLEAYLGRAWRVDKLPIKYPSRKYAFIASLILLGIVARRRDTKAA
ncbi:MULTISPECIES: class I SAM-dependent methyltransferase [Methylosinus]|nr:MULTISPECIES: class I SAM-dependent methyltransferase [Methylosinus]MBU3890366.1 class I SAM-dependent methyltransferase [Methylosinus sp. KRF6]